MAVFDEKAQVLQGSIPAASCHPRQDAVYVHHASPAVSTKQMFATFDRMEVSIIMALAPAVAVTSTMALMTA